MEIKTIKLYSESFLKTLTIEQKQAYLWEIENERAELGNRQAGLGSVLAAGDLWPDDKAEWSDEYDTLGDRISVLDERIYKVRVHIVLQILEIARPERFVPIPGIAPMLNLKGIVSSISAGAKSLKKVIK